METSLTQRAMRWLRCAASVCFCCAGLAGCQTARMAALSSGSEEGRMSLSHALGAPIVTEVEAHNDSSGPAAPEREPMPDVPILDLETALRRAGVDNPIIALADEMVRTRQAERLQAQALLFPTLQSGFNYHEHRGVYQANNGAIVNVNMQTLYGGFGAGAVAAGTVAAPGIQLVAHLGEACYAPQAAQQKVTQSRFDAVAVRQYTLLDVGMCYLALVAAHARVAAYQQSLKDLDQLVHLTAANAKSGQGRYADAERARSEFLLLQAEAAKAHEEIGVANAEMARLLDVDPSTPFRPADLTPPLYDVVDPQANLGQLLEEAWSRHPEVIARGADMRYQEILVRQERVRPWLPTIAAGVSFGMYGGGTDTMAPRLGNFGPRTDIDVAAIWSLQNLGLGNRATQNGARAALNQATVEQRRLFDRISREVSEAFALIQARRLEIDLARSRLETAQRAFGQEVTRARNLQALPIEVLVTVNQLTAARQDLIRAMIGYSQAQLQLHVALGNPPNRGTGAAINSAAPSLR